MDEYRPVDCSLHDQLEAFATTGQPCRISYEADDGTRLEARDRIEDVYAEAGVEYIRTAAGDAIRLDRIRRVDGIHAEAVDDPHPDEVHGHP